MIAQRVLAILSAALLVGSVALATLGPPDVPLGQALFMLDHDSTASWLRGLEHGLPAWMWNGICTPMLLRPVWLIPAGLGLLCCGASLTLASRTQAQRSHRRRS